MHHLLLKLFTNSNKSNLKEEKNRSVEILNEIVKRTKSTQLFSACVFVRLIEHVLLIASWFYFIGITTKIPTNSNRRAKEIFVCSTDTLWFSDRSHTDKMVWWQYHTELSITLEIRNKETTKSTFNDVIDARVQVLLCFTSNGQIMKRIMEKHTQIFEEKIGEKIQQEMRTEIIWNCVFFSFVYIFLSFLASFSPSLSFYSSFRFVCSLWFSNDMIEIVSTRASISTQTTRSSGTQFIYLFERLASWPFKLETINNHSHTLPND